METKLDFEVPATKELLAKLDFEFFMNQNFVNEGYESKEVDVIYSSYKSNLDILEIKAKKNQKQFSYYVEGQVRKMYTGGLLPALFELDESRGHRFIDFNGIGENWAYFAFWQKRHRGKLNRQKIWDYTIKSGSILAILLAVIKVIETIIKLK